MSSIHLDKLSLKNYDKIIGEAEVERIYSLAERLNGRSVIHVNSTSFGGGVAEILRRLIPLMQDVGIDAEWKVIEGKKDFFNVTKNFHNALQGAKMQLAEEMKKIYLRNCELNAQLLDLDYDFVVLHDPQTLGIIDYEDDRKGKWIWRCHIDLSQPNKEYWNFLQPYISKYDTSVFSLRKYVRKPLEKRNVAIIPPTIDPLSDKNRTLQKSKVLSTLDRYDVDPNEPILTQVARFDPWKDPMGVIDAYTGIKKEIADVQLLLISSMASDDPEGWIYYEKAVRHAGEDYNIHFLTDLIGVGDMEVNAFQRATDIALLKSIREGFGLSVAEALWKEVPVIGGNVGGIPLQIINNKTGFLVDTIKETIKKALYLLKHPQEAQKLGKGGKKHVAENFLITRHLKDYLTLFSTFV
jgi:trehalose synthase